MSDAAASSPLRLTYREACKQALRQALIEDPRVFLMGEDIGRYGGCYAVTKGMLEEFGEVTHQGYALGRKRHHRRGDWRGDGGHEAHRRGHDLQLQPSRPRPDCQQCGDDSAYVRRAVCHPPDYPHGDRRRTARRGATFAFSSKDGSRTFLAFEY